MAIVSKTVTDSSHRCGEEIQLSLHNDNILRLTCIKVAARAGTQLCALSQPDRFPWHLVPKKAHSCRRQCLTLLRICTTRPLHPIVKDLHSLLVPIKELVKSAHLLFQHTQVIENNSKQSWLFILISVNPTHFLRQILHRRAERDLGPIWNQLQRTCKDFFF